ncbi:MAG: 2-hydroxymuconate semialdehyde hydrolase [Bacteroidota bacterium]|jgi:pimeloyl-ACP methyl ester carboxylesterase
MTFLSKIFRFALFFLLAATVLICLLFGYWDKSVADLKPKYATTPSAFVEINGLNVHYRDEGNVNDSLPMVLIHGTGSSLHTFDQWAEMLKTQKRVVRMDLPAYGLTGPFLSRNYSMEHYTTFIEQFLAARGIQKCILGGNSLGGQIAWQFTIRKPEMVSKLILIDASGYPIQSKSTPIAFRLARTPVLNQIMKWITPRFMAKMSVENVYFDKTKVSAALIDRYFDLTLRAGNRQAFVDRLTTAQTSDNLPKIKTIQQPTLVLWGEQDLLIPVEHAHHWHADLPNDTLAILKNAGHVPMEESPKESLEPVLSFLKQK